MMLLGSKRMPLGLCLDKDKSLMANTFSDALIQSYTFIIPYFSINFHGCLHKGFHLYLSNSAFIKQFYCRMTSLVWLSSAK